MVFEDQTKLETFVYKFATQSMITDYSFVQNDKLNMRHRLRGRMVSKNICHQNKIFVLIYTVLCVIVMC